VAAEWDGIVGLGFTPTGVTFADKMYETLVDNLYLHEDLQNKFFSFYLPDEKGFITFGEIPQDIVGDTSKIDWAPLNEKQENPWTIRLKDIIVETSSSNTVYSSRFREISSELIQQRSAKKTFFAEDSSNPCLG